MDRIGASLIAASLIVCLSLATAPGAAQFTSLPGVLLNNHLGHTIDFNLGKNIGIGNTAFGLAGLDVKVTWGANYDLGAAATGAGSVTQGDLGYGLGISVDAVQGNGFNGAAWGIPNAQQAVSATHMEKDIAEQAQINLAQGLL